MSKIGEKIVKIPSSVTVELRDRVIFIKGTHGELNIDFPKVIEITKGEDGIRVKRTKEDKRTKSLHGLYRSIIANAVQGVEKQWEKRLEIVGTGYNASLQGENLVLKLGYSHPLVVKKVSGVNFKLEGNNKITILSHDKHLAGQVAHKIKMLKKPDPYKGKGIRYEGEVLRLKPGKKAKTAGPA